VKDADEILARMRVDLESDWPTRLLEAISKAPIAEERNLRIPRPSESGLSSRELDVLRCMSRGMTLPQVADTLCLSFHTVYAHLRNARFRLRAKNAAHACCEAIRQGLIP
jgi:DNA-binding CsgD family transcriptional regulator